MKFDKHLGSAADWKSLNPNIAASILRYCGTTFVRLVNRGPYILGLTYVTTMVADALAPVRPKAISKHHVIRSDYSVSLIWNTHKALQ